MKSYLEVTFVSKDGPTARNVKTSEVYFINKFVIEEAVDGKCCVESVKCTDEEYNKIFENES